MANEPSEARAELPRRVEQLFHDAIWGLANDSSAIERAVSEARDLCYTVLHCLADESKHERIEYTVNHWLDTYGRDMMHEEGRR